MAYIYVRDEDSTVVGVFEEQQTAPVAHTEFIENWLNYAPWWRVKVIRNGPGDYFNTEETHPDDNDGLM